MKPKLEDILARVGKGELSPEEAGEALKHFPYQDLGYAKIDHHRELRKGFPEVVYGGGKSDEQIIGIAREIVKKGGNLLVTRIEEKTFRKLKKTLPKTVYNRQAKAAILRQKKADPGKGLIVVMTAGTSDVPVGEEAAVTCEMLGNEVDRVYDVGVAGLHRLLGEYDKLRRARVVIVAAGMEGALPSVVAGLVAVPVVAVPTSIGYGASFKGVAALLAMLNSCPGGIGVVNIDNGFGAACLASLINHL